jgi:alpha-L-rhamnosidase
VIDDRATNPQTAAVMEVRAEQRDDALGVACATPRLSWKIGTSIADWKQTAYEVEITGPRRKAASTGRTESPESVLVSWPFAPLSSRERVDVRIRVWDDSDTPTAWSELLPIEGGLFDPGDWQADFIGPDWDEDLSSPQPSPYLRAEFDLPDDIVQARLYITALGVYEPYLNGEVVGDHVLAPGWTSYNHRLRVQTLDVTEHVRPGRNAIGAIIGDGWYRGRLGPNGGRRNIYGDHLALLAQLEVAHADATTTVIVTDGAWRATTGPLLSTDLYDGETYDARLELDGWAEPGFDDGSWAGVIRVEHAPDTLVQPPGPPVRRTQCVRPVSITRSPQGKAIVDFGQNLVGRLRIRVRGDAGDVVTLRHAEILERGELCVRPLRQAAATDRYFLRGGGVELWEPRFTFHGFRYAELDGWPGELQAEDVEAVVCHSDLRRTGSFSSSDEMLNRLHENVVWSMRGNFLDVPTDCAQRDERLGWSGDVQIFAPTGLFLYDIAGFLTSWLEDLAAEQAEDGRVPNVVPEVLDGLRRGNHVHDAPAAAWGDAAVIVPWRIYELTGDRGILERQYASMCGWVNLVEKLAGPRRIWSTGFQYGDWLDPSAAPDRPERGQTDPTLVATAYFARSSELLARAADALGLDEDAARHRRLHDDVAEEFRREFVKPDGQLSRESTTAYSLAICFGLLASDEERQCAGKRLSELLAQDGYHISTGFVGTPLICDALCQAGVADDAYRLLFQRECPSWLYPLTMGATTIWERWDSLLPDGSLNPGEMTSFNHYAFGAIADWLHRTVAGLAAAEPGYRRIAVAPHPGGGLTHARATHETPYGPAEVSWSTANGGLRVEAVIPPNTTATVQLPGREAPFSIGSGRYDWQVGDESQSSTQLETLAAS